MPKPVDPSKPTKHPRKSEAHWEELRTGAAIGKQLVPLKSVKEVAAIMGLSETAVRNAECRALAKIAAAMRIHAMQLNPNLKYRTPCLEERCLPAT